jgi:hypothetical protein
MAQSDFDVRREMIGLLLQRISDDEYPSASMMDMVEYLLGPDELPIYVAVLMDKIQSDEYPSIPLMRRVLSLV